jgi:DUF4097 and DUF4098 domain-containing protein YvlB
VLGLWGTCLAVPAWAAGRAIDQQVTADPQGQVEIINVTGQVTVIGWDKPEIEVSGTLGADVEKVDIASTGTHTTVRVVVKESEHHWGLSMRDAGEAELTVYVPRGSSLDASLVNSGISVRDLQGDQELQTVSGDVRTSAARAVRVHTVSGDAHVTAGPESALLEVSSVSGDLEVTGGHGDITVSTVSGTARLALGNAAHVRVKSVSGDYELHTGLTPDGVLEAQSVSGDVSIEFTHGLPPADFELHSFSGDVKTCFGQKSEHERYGPGSKLQYREGAGSAHVHVDTNSGDVSVCTRSTTGASGSPPDVISEWLRVGLRVRLKGDQRHAISVRPLRCRQCQMTS